MAKKRKADRRKGADRRKNLSQQPPRRKLAVAPPSDLAELIVGVCNEARVSVSAVLTTIVLSELERRQGDVSDVVEQIKGKARKARKAR